MAPATFVEHFEKHGAYELNDASQRGEVAAPVAPSHARY